MKFVAALIGVIAQASDPEEQAKKVQIDIVMNTFCCFCGLNWVALKHYILDQDLGAIVDVRPNTLFPLPPGEHQAQCSSLSNSYTTSCNFLTDGAVHCARRHSAQWPDFTDCIMRMNWDGDKGNPLSANETSYDENLKRCASTMKDYSMDKFLTCTYGEKTDTEKYSISESDSFQRENVDTIRQLWKHNGEKKDGLIWANVAGKLVYDPIVDTPKNHPRDPWIKKMISAICDAYTGDISKFPSCVNADEAMAKVATTKLVEPADPCIPDDAQVV